MSVDDALPIVLGTCGERDVDALRPHPGFFAKNQCRNMFGLGIRCESGWISDVQDDVSMNRNLLCRCDPFAHFAS